MTGLLFGAILVATIAGWIALLITSSASPGRRVALMLMAFAPAFLFSSVILTAFATAPAGDYRVALEAVSFELIDDVVTVGGAGEGDDADDLIVHDLPAHYLTFRRQGDGVVVELPPELAQESEQPVYSAVRVDDAKPFSNSVLIDSDATINAQPFVRADRKLDGAAFPAIPARRQEIWSGGPSVPILRNLTAETMIFPLRYWARPNGTEAPVENANGAPLGTFLSFEAPPVRGTTFWKRAMSLVANTPRIFTRGAMYLTLTGDGTTIASHGVTTEYQRAIATIQPGQTRRFALYRLDYADPQRGEDARSAAQERRSFRATYKDQRLLLVLDTPDVYRLSSESVASLLARQEEKDEILLTTRDPRRNAPVAANQMVLSYRQLGPRLQNELYSAIRIADVKDCGLRVTTHTGTRCYSLGDAFSIGDSAAAILRVTQMKIPWGIILTLFALALIAIAWPAYDQQHPAAAIITSAAEILLSVRLLIAFEGGILDPASASALWQSVVAFAVLPLALRVAWLYRLYREGHAFSGGDKAEVIARALATALVAAVALWHARASLFWIAAGAVALTIALASTIGIVEWVIRRFASDSSLRKLLWFAAAITAVRVGMWLGPGWKERISIGGSDLAVTVVYLPLVFLYFALLWRRFAVAGTSPLTIWGRLSVLLAIGFGGLLMVGLPYLVRDSGSAFVHLPAVLLLFALPMLARRPTLRTLGAGTFLLLLIATHLLLFFVPHLRGVEEAGDPSKDETYHTALTSESEAMKFLQTRLKASTNELRVMSHISPHQLEAAGTSKAEGLVAQRRMLDRYSGRGALGAGYLNVPLAVFRDTHLNDNLPAIHILAPFGLAGGAGVVGMLVALALLPTFAVFRAQISGGDTPEQAIDARNALGILCLWTFSVAGIYMFAANTGLVLFTGKNVYLLAAASRSDIAEGGMLLLVGLLALHQDPKP